MEEDSTFGNQPSANITPFSINDILNGKRRNEDLQEKALDMSKSRGFSGEKQFSGLLRLKSLS